MYKWDHVVFVFHWWHWSSNSLCSQDWSGAQVFFPTSLLLLSFHVSSSLPTRMPFQLLYIQLYLSHLILSNFNTFSSIKHFTLLEWQGFCTTHPSSNIPIKRIKYITHSLHYLTIMICNIIRVENLCLALMFLLTFNMSNAFSSN